MKSNEINDGKNALAEMFKARAEAVAARVSVTQSDAEVQSLIDADKAKFGTDNVGVVHAARGIAETGTCVVETDSEEIRLATMLPEASIIVLNVSYIVPGLPDIASYLRERQKDGKISYTSLITGPSRTADIERIGAIGVHGPLSVHIILQEG